MQHGFKTRSGGKALFTLLSALICCLLFTAAGAHEGRPVFIQLDEAVMPLKPGQQENYLQYQLRWKIPPVVRPGEEPFIGLRAQGCTSLAKQKTQALSGQKTFQCQYRPPRLAVQIDYPLSNPALSSLLLVNSANGSSQQFFSPPEQSEVVIPPEPEVYNLARQYTAAGIKHILLGLDHLLFVICLMILAGTFGRMLLTITGFTLAHSVTLGLAALDMIAVPVLFVEMLIALSIVLLAAGIMRTIHASANIRKKDTISERYPMVVASGFGLLHGFGFASVLASLGLPVSMKVPALLFFNLGIEIGQILFIVVCLIIAHVVSLGIVKSRHQVWLLSSIIYVVGVVASFWLLQRLFIMI